MCTPVGSFGDPITLGCGYITQLAGGGRLGGCSPSQLSMSGCRTQSASTVFVGFTLRWTDHLVDLADHLVELFCGHSFSLDA
jgi:hypothetical protein